MSAKVAVNTYFLFGRLFHMIRSQFCNLTREACNYLGEDHKAIASHFLVTTEFLLTQFQLPKVYIDAEMVKGAGILEQTVFLVLELQDTLVNYMEKKRIVSRVSLCAFSDAFSAHTLTYWILLNLHAMCRLKVQVQITWILLFTFAVHN